MKYKIYRQTYVGAEKQFTPLATPLMLTDGSTARCELQGEDYLQIKHTTSIATPLALREGDFIVDARFGRYLLADTPIPTINGSAMEYALKFEAEHRLFRKYLFRLILDARSETTWSLTDLLDRHLDRFLACLQANDIQCYDAASNTLRPFTCIVHYEETDSQTGLRTGVVPKERRLVSYENTDMLSALDLLAETFECEWWRDGNVLHFGYLGEEEERDANLSPSSWQDVSLTTRLGATLADGTATVIAPQQSSGERATRIYVAGGTRNIPSKYRRALVLTTSYIEGVKGETEFNQTHPNGGVSAFLFRDPLRPIKRTYLRGVQETVQYNDTISANGLFQVGTPIDALTAQAQETLDLTPYRGITANVIWNNTDPSAPSGCIDIAIERMEGWCVMPQLYFIDKETNLVLGFLNIILCGKLTNFSGRKEIRVLFPTIQTLGRPVHCEFRYTYYKLKRTNGAAGGGASAGGFAQSAEVYVGDSTATFYTSVAWFNADAIGMTSIADIVRTGKQLDLVRKWLGQGTVSLFDATLLSILTGSFLNESPLAPLSQQSPTGGIDTSLGGGFGGKWNWGIEPDNTGSIETPTTPTTPDVEVPPFVYAQMTSVNPRVEIVRNKMQLIDLADGATITVSYNDALRPTDEPATEEEQTALLAAKRDEELNGIKFQMSDRDAWYHLSPTRRLLIPEQYLDPSTPSAYYSDLYEAGTAYHLGERRLLLPSKEGTVTKNGVPLHYTPHYVELATNLEHPQQTREIVKTYDDEFPRYIFQVGEVASCRRLAQREVMDDHENNGITRDTFFRQYYIVDDAHTDSTWFKREWLLNGETLRIHFQTGALAGMEFDLTLDADIEGDDALTTYTPISEALNHVQQLQTLLEQAPQASLPQASLDRIQAQADEAQAQLSHLLQTTATPLLQPDHITLQPTSAPLDRPRFKIIRNEDYGATFPNEECHPNVGDQFLLIGWNIAYAASVSPLGDTNAITAAEEHLRERAISDLLRLAQNDRTYECTLAPTTRPLDTDQEGNYLPAPVPKILRLGAAVKVQDPNTGETRRSRVIAYECPLDLPFDAPRITCGIAPSYSRLADIEGRLRKASKEK